MTVLSAMQSAAIRLIGRKPTTFFGSSEVFELEITDLVNEVAQDIAKYQDWAILTRIHTLSGDGSTTSFPLPLDYDRMLVDAMMQNKTNWVWGYYRFDDINSFTTAQNAGFGPWPGGWLISGYGVPGSPIRFEPAPSGDAQFPYMSNQWALASNGTTSKPAFDNDADSFMLPERLLTLGLVWRWRDNKGYDSTGDQEAFIKALDEYGAKDGGSKTIRKRVARHIPNTYPAWPWTLGGV